MSIELICAVLLMTFSLIFGGGSSRPHNELLLVAVAALCLIATTWTSRKALKPAKGLRWLIFPIIAVLLLQLIPLPPSWMFAHSGAADYVDGVLDLQGWRPLALSPDATLYALLCLTPAFTMMWLCASLDRREREVVITWLLGASIIMGLIGIAQATDTVSFSMYDVYHGHVAIGLFASRNNFADLIIITTPMIFAMRGVWRRRYGNGTADFILHALLIVNLFAMIASASRAGLVVFGMVLLLSYFFSTPAHLRLRFLAIVSALGAVGSFVLWLLPLTGALKVIADRFSAGEDARWEIWRNSWRVARAYWPYGAGAGNFRLAYEQFEPLHSVTAAYVNAAHNEYLQPLIEFGVAGVLLAVLIPGYVIVRMFSNREDPLAVFAFFGLLGIMAHALVDYPFRMIGINVLIAVLTILCVSPASGKLSRSARRSPSKPTGQPDARASRIG